MLTATLRRLSFAFIVPAWFGVVPAAQATTITFDGTFMSPVPPNVSPVSLDYDTPTLTPPNTFVTQGFTFSGFTAGVTGSLNTQPELSIATDPAGCSAELGTTCVSDGSQYLAAADPFGFYPISGSGFAIHTFDASQVFGPGGCPLCGPNGVPNATTLQVTGFRMGVVVAQETFQLSSSFQQIVLTDPDWLFVTRAVFLPTDGSGGQGYAAIDNINADPIPEPASGVLLSSGIAGLGLAVRRRFRLKS